MKILGNRLLVKVDEYYISGSGIYLSTDIFSHCSCVVQGVGIGVKDLVLDGDIVYYSGGLVRYDCDLYFLEYDNVYCIKRGDRYISVNNHCLVEVLGDNDVISFGGKEIYFDNSFDKGLYTPVMCVVVGLPDFLYYNYVEIKQMRGISLMYDVDIDCVIGDLVYVKWKSVNSGLGRDWHNGESDEVGRCLYKSERGNKVISVRYDSLICRYDDIYGVYCMNDYLLIKPDVLLEETDLVLPDILKDRVSSRLGVVVADGDIARGGLFDRDVDVCVGDRVLLDNGFNLLLESSLFRSLYDYDVYAVQRYGVIGKLSKDLLINVKE